MNALKLAIFGFLTSALVGLVYVWTAEPIAKAQQDARDATIRAMLSEVDEIGLGIETSLTDARLLEQLGWSTPIVIRALTRNDAVVGYLVPIRAPSGYSGPIDLILAVTTEPRILAVRVTTHRETPGLGDGIDHRKSDWIQQFAGYALDTHAAEDWIVRPDGGVIDAFTGATITTRAVVNGLRRAMSALTNDPSWPSKLEVR